MSILFFRCGKSNQKKIKMEPETALAIINANKIGRGSFQTMKKIIKVSTGNDIFPSWDSIKTFRNFVTPPTIDIMKSTEEGIEYFSGIHFTYIDALTITLKQLCKILNIDTSKDLKLIVHLKYGWDGSGGHKIFNQANNVQSENIIMAMFCVLEICYADSKELLWKQNAPNSEFNQRPLLLLLGKY